MAPSSTYMDAPVPEPATEVCDTAHLVIPPSLTTDMNAESVDIPIDKWRLSSRSKQDDEVISSSTIRLAHAATGRIKEVTIISGTVQAAGRIQDEVEVYPVAEITDLIQSQILDLPDIELEVSEELQSNNPRLCEAVLRSVLAPRAPGESLDDCMQSAEAVKQAFTLQPSVYSKAESRALKVAQYRRAEVQLKLEALKQDEDVLAPPTQFDDPVVYQSWKVEELQALSNLVDLFGNLPSFSGGVQVEILSGEDLKPEPAQKCTPPVFKKKPLETQVYCSVTILPARPGAISSPVESVDCLLGGTPAYFSEVVTCTGDAEWNTRSPWIPVSSLQDKILIEVWEKTDDVVKVDEPEQQPEVVTKRKLKFGDLLAVFNRHSSTQKKKVAPWSGDTFLGQVIVSFSHIESQALAHGGVQGQSPATSYMLVDERGKQGMSTIQLQFTCSCERFYRDAPPNKLLLMPPIEEIETAFDNLVRLAFHAENEALFQLGPQWRQLVYGFGSHYRIREERCALGMVNVMTGMFQEDARYCIGIVPEWLSACNAAKDGRLTRSELALHCHIVVLLMKPAVNALENFQTFFPSNKPKGAILRLIELLGLILRWEPNPADILVPLRNFVQNSCERRLEKQLFKETADGESRKISIQLLVKAVKLVRSDIVEHNTTYKGAFPDGFDLPQHTAPMYYKLICHYVTTFVSANSSKDFTEQHGELIAELVLLHEDIEKLGVYVESMDVVSLLNGNVKQWIGSIGPRMIDWIRLSVTKPFSEPLPLQTGPHMSFTTVDLYVMIVQVVDDVAMRLSALPFREEYIFALEDAICECVYTYVEGLGKLCMKEVTGKAEKISGSHPLEHSTFSLSKPLYLQLNNINAVLGGQERLESILATKWHDFASNTARKQYHLGDIQFKEDFCIRSEVTGNRQPQSGIGYAILDYKMHGKFIKLRESIQNALTEIIDAVVECIQTQFVRQLQWVLQAKEAPNEMDTEEELQSLTKLVDQHVTAMKEMLHPDLLLTFLADMHTAILWSMLEISLNGDECCRVRTHVQCQYMERALTTLNDDFYRLGDATSSITKQGSAQLRKVLASCNMKPRELCALYWRSCNSFSNGSSAESGEHWTSKRVLNENLNGEGDCKANDNHAQNEDIVHKMVSKDLHVQGTMIEVQLHPLNYLSILRQKEDDEAQELVMKQTFVANNKYLQMVLGLPVDEEILALSSCRLLRNVPGMLYITAKHVCFVEYPGVSGKKKFSSFLTLEQILRIEVAGHNDTLVFMSMNNQPVRISRISMFDLVFQVIIQQVAGTGTVLEKY